MQKVTVPVCSWTQAGYDCLIAALTNCAVTHHPWHIVAAASTIGMSFVNEIEEYHARSSQCRCTMNAYAKHHNPNSQQHELLSPLLRAGLCISKQDTNPVNCEWPPPQQKLTWIPFLARLGWFCVRRNIPSAIDQSCVTRAPFLSILLCRHGWVTQSVTPAVYVSKSFSSPILGTGKWGVPTCVWENKILPTLCPIQFPEMQGTLMSTSFCDVPGSYQNGTSFLKLY